LISKQQKVCFAAKHMSEIIFECGNLMVNRTSIFNPDQYNGDNEPSDTFIASLEGEGLLIHVLVWFESSVDFTPYKPLKTQTGPV